MKWIYSPETLQGTDRDLSTVIGGKGKALFELYSEQAKGIFYIYNYQISANGEIILFSTNIDETIK